MKIVNDKKIRNIGIVTCLLLLLSATATALIVTTTVSDTLHYSESISANLGLIFLIREGCNPICTGLFHYSEFFSLPNKILRDVIPYTESAFPIAPFGILIIKDALHYIDAKCSMCNIIVTNTITLTSIISSTGSNNQFVANDTPIDFLATTVILPLVPISIVLIVVTTKFREVADVLLLPALSMIVLSLASFTILPKSTMLLVAIIAAIIMAYLASKWISGSSGGEAA